MAVSDGVVYAAVVNLPGHVKAAADLDKPVLPVDFTEGTGRSSLSMSGPERSSGSRSSTRCRSAR